MVVATGSRWDAAAEILSTRSLGVRRLNFRTWSSRPLHAGGGGGRFLASFFSRIHRFLQVRQWTLRTARSAFGDVVEDGPDDVFY
jgi:hypothetical protein